AVQDRRHVSHRITAARVLNLDDLRAKLGEHQRREAARNQSREVEHANAGEGEKHYGCRIRLFRYPYVKYRTIPTSTHQPNRDHAWGGSPCMMKMQPAAPSGATSQTSAPLNGRGRAGSFTRRMRTPSQTSANANSVPMFVRSYVSAASPTADATATTIPVTSVVAYGMRVFGSTRAPHCGSN